MQRALALQLHSEGVLGIDKSIYLIPALRGVLGGDHLTVDETNGTRWVHGIELDGEMFELLSTMGVATLTY